MRGRTSYLPEGFTPLKPRERTRSSDVIRINQECYVPIGGAKYCLGVTQSQTYGGKFPPLYYRDRRPAARRAERKGSR